MSAIHSKSSLVTPHQIAIESAGENVQMRIGNAVIGFHYEDALKISAWLRLKAKEAKRRAGDTSRRWYVIGTLEDLKV